MKTNADLLVDRSQLKKQISKWRALAILLSVVSLLVIIRASLPASGKTYGEDYIARITIEGIVGDNQKMYDLITSVKDDDNIKAVIVWLDTPGGSAVGGEEIYLKLREMAKKKPVVAVMRSISASAGYMIALGADQIFARSGTITGSIGVLIETAEITELAEKLGIKPITIKSAPLKAAPSPFEKSTPEAEKVIKDMIMDFYNHFVDIVAERRNISKKKALELADGRVYSGNQAVVNKLIDAIGGEEEAKEWLVKNRKIKKDIEVFDVEIEKKQKFIEKLLESFSGFFWQKSRVGLDGLSALWHPELN